MIRGVGLRTAAAALLVVATLTGCATQHPDYYYAPYPNGHRIDPTLAAAEQATAKSLARGELTQILTDRTALSANNRMKLFLTSYAGHPTRIVRMNPSDDATAEEWLLIDCPHVPPERVMLVWAWLHNAWRAYPAYHLFPLQHCG